MPAGVLEIAAQMDELRNRLLGRYGQSGQESK
jgi:hypothetical protein